VSLESDIELLRTVPLFSDFNADQRRMIAFGAETQHFTAGNTIFSIADEAESGFVIVSGEVGLAAPPQRAQDPDNRYGHGSLLGELALLAPTTRQTNAVALSDVEVLEIRRAMLRRMLREYPDLADRMWTRLARQLNETTSLLMSIREKFLSEST
jgi:CRP-like cAMP-binding protein